MKALYSSTLLAILCCFCLLPGFGSDTTSPVGNAGSSSIDAEIVAQAPYVVTDPAGSEPCWAALCVREAFHENLY
jgi:hypothetical protein